MEEKGVNADQINGKLTNLKYLLSHFFFESLLILS